MHYTKLCLAHLYLYTLDCALAKPELEIQEEQSLCEYGGPQATSCRDTNTAFGSRQAPVHHTQSLTFNLISIFMLRMIVH
jgi:hypothetical protein